MDNSFVTYFRKDSLMISTITFSWDSDDGYDHAWMSIIRGTINHLEYKKIKMFEIIFKQDFKQVIQFISNNDN